MWDIDTLWFQLRVRADFSRWWAMEKHFMRVTFYEVDDARDPGFVETYALSDGLWDGSYRGEIAFR